MKNIKIILVIFLVSFAINGISAKALNSAKVNFAGFTIPKSGDPVSISNKVKADESYQVMDILGTYLNRDIKYKITCDQYGASDFLKLAVPSEEIIYALGAESALVSSQYQAIVFAGTKELTLKTSTSWLTTTSLSGIWWLSINDFKTIEGNYKLNKNIITIL